MNFRTLDDLPLMSKEDISARLRTYVVTGTVVRRPELMQKDIAKWLGVSPVTVKHVGAKRIPCSKRLQVRITQFFNLLDNGHIQFIIDGKTRAIVRTDPRRPPIQPPVRKERARIDFSSGFPKMVLA